MRKPSYADVAPLERSDHIAVYREIAKGSSSYVVALATNRSHSGIAIFKKQFLSSEVQQLSQVVLKNGTVIPLSDKQASQVALIMLVASNGYKVIKIPGYMPFKIMDIETDAEKILKLTQVQLDFESYPQPRTMETRKNY